MINLLPYSSRIQLKSLYKKRLIVVGLFGIATVFLPLVLVVGVFSYVQFINFQFINNNYEKLLSIQNSTETENLSSQVKSINQSIKFFESSIISSQNVTDNIEKLINLRPVGIILNSFDFKKDNKKSTINIKGIASSRATIIQYSNILDYKNGGICHNINIPVDTYTKKNEVPFNLVCMIDYEVK